MNIWASSTRDGWPPSTWLAPDSWPIPVVLDNQAQTVSTAFGVTSVPFTVFVDADGIVLGRLAGAIPMSDLLDITDQVFG